MTFSRSQSYAIDMTFLDFFQDTTLEKCLIKFRIFLKSYGILMHISLENVITQKFKRFCHYLPFLEKLKILKFWQIFGKNDTFPEISCYDIFMAFIKKIKNLISVILLPFLISGIVSFSNSILDLELRGWPVSEFFRPRARNC